MNPKIWERSNNLSENQVYLEKNTITSEKHKKFSDWWKNNIFQKTGKAELRIGKMELKLKSLIWKQFNLKEIRMWNRGEKTKRIEWVGLIYTRLDLYKTI